MDAPSNAFALDHLRSALQTMVACVRRVARPAWLLVAGLAYQSVVLGGTFGVIVFAPVMDKALPGIGQTILGKMGLNLQYTQFLKSLFDRVASLGPVSSIALVPFALVLFRLAAGLAHLSSRVDWDKARGDRRMPTLRSSWKIGKGFALAGLGMWLLFPLMMFIATVLFVGPIQLFVGSTDLSSLRFLGTLAAGGLVALLMGYSFMLSVLFQLALQSLVRNQRGVGSAIQHSWRLVKAGPVRVIRATAVDMALYFTTVTLHLSILLAVPGLDFSIAHLTAPSTGETAIQGFSLWFMLPIALFSALLYGAMGCARSAFWTRAYFTLGGISTVDEGSGLVGAVGGSPAA